MGLLHFAEDWKILCDQKSSLVLPVFLAVTTLRPDLIIYSVQTRVVIIIELTSPCEENFEDRHKQKVDKYFALCEAIRFNKWTVHFHAIEVGARGYCASNVRSCLRKLGFSNKACKSLLRTVSITAIKSSFAIFMSKNNKNWNMEASDCTSTVATEVASNKGVSNDEQEISFNQTVHLPSFVVKSDNTSTSFVGLQNKGNTCYANSILQCLRNLPEFVHTCLSEGNDNQLLSAFNSVMRLMHNARSPVDPSDFLKALQVVIHKAGNKRFILTYSKMRLRSYSI